MSLFYVSEEHFKSLFLYKILLLTIIFTFHDHLNHIDIQVSIIIKEIFGQLKTVRAAKINIK